MNHLSIEKLSDDELKKIVLSTGGGQVPCFTSRLDGEIKEEMRRRFVSPDLKTSIHMLLNGIKECRKCPACGNEYPVYGVKNGWYDTCSLKCRHGVVDKDEKERKRRETCLKKYGVGNPSQNAKVREKNGIKLLQFDDWTIKTDFDSLKPVILSHLGDTSNDNKIVGEVVEIDNMNGDRAAVERLGYKKVERRPPTFLLTDGSKITTDGHRKYFNCGVDIYVKS